MPALTPLRKTAAAALPLLPLLALLAAPTAMAALKTGASAPDFTVQAAQGGKAFSFNLVQALKKGPVVLYFYPKSYTAGCTLEAHLFAEATPRFKAMGATVIGVSRDDIETQQRFSKSECRDQFAVAADAQSSVIKAYDVEMMLVSGMAQRVSYVIAADGKVAAVHDSVNPEGHIGAMLKAVQALVPDKAVPALVPSNTLPALVPTK